MFSSVLLVFCQSEMFEKLDKADVEIETGQETLQELAGKSGVDERRLIAVLVSRSSPDKDALAN